VTLWYLIANPFRVHGIPTNGFQTSLYSLEITGAEQRSIGAIVDELEALDGI